jgi:hypothetical protein
VHLLVLDASVVCGQYGNIVSGKADMVIDEQPVMMLVDVLLNRIENPVARFDVASDTADVRLESRKGGLHTIASFVSALSRYFIHKPINRGAIWLPPSPYQ